MEDDVQQLLEKVDQLAANLGLQYAKANAGGANSGPSKVDMKIAMEQLRSVLDYLAVGMVRACGIDPSNKRIYFPYGDRKVVGERIAALFKGATNPIPALGGLIHSVQSYSTGTNWLHELCRQTNESKHKGLTKHSEKKTEGLVLGGNAIAIGPNSTVEIRDCVINSVPVGWGGGVVINGSEPIQQVAARLPGVQVHRTPMGVEYWLGGTTWDALRLITTARAGIGELAKAISCELKGTKT